MKKTLGISVLSTMLILGQPFMALADTVDTTAAKTSTTSPAVFDTATGNTTTTNAAGSDTAPADSTTSDTATPGTSSSDNTATDANDVKTINFADIESIVQQQNLNVQMNENDKLKTEAGYTGLTKTINDLQDDLDDVNDMVGLAGGSAVGQISTSKNSLLSTLKQSQYAAADKPTYEAISALNASMDNDIQTYTAENVFIGYNQSKLQSTSTALDLDLTKDQISAMQLQASLGMVANSDLNDLKTKLVSDQTTIESAQFQQDSLERQLQNLLNEQDSDLEIGALPADSISEFSIADKDADLQTALANSYTIKLEQEQIVLLQNSLDRYAKDNGKGSKQYKQAKYDLANANLTLTQLQDNLKSDYYKTVDNIASLQSTLRLAQQSLADKQVKLSQAQLKKSLGLISQLDLDQATNDYQVQDNSVKAAQIQLFTTIRGYSWFLRGMPSSSSSSSASA